MKISALPLIAAAVLLAALGLSSAHAQNYPVPRFSYAMSPDHPKTWVDGATRTHQDLRWNTEKRLLVADVTYSTAEYADNTHPPEEDNFVLTFPSVKFDAATKRFLAGGKVVATLQDGFFGHHIVLARDVQLSIHRHHGAVYGAFVPGSSDDE